MTIKHVLLALLYAVNLSNFSMNYTRQDVRIELTNQYLLTIPKSQ